MQSWAPKAGNFRKLISEADGEVGSRRQEVMKGAAEECGRRWGISVGRWGVDWE
ncbi:MAG: hypothetical protein ACKERG_02360 [Candidatus Hodgkinia cicadicola]